MDPNLTEQSQPFPPVEQPDPEKDDKYAQSLLQALDAQMQMEQQAVPKKKKFFTTKKLIFIGISISLSIVSMLLAPKILQSTTGTNPKDQAQELINGARYVQELEK
jgi:hypothetical protein